MIFPEYVKVVKTYMYLSPQFFWLSVLFPNATLAHIHPKAGFQLYNGYQRSG